MPGRITTWGIRKESVVQRTQDISSQRTISAALEITFNECFTHSRKNESAMRKATHKHSYATLADRRKKYGTRDGPGEPEGKVLSKALAMAAGIRHRDNTAGKSRSRKGEGRGDDVGMQRELTVPNRSGEVPLSPGRSGTPRDARGSPTASAAAVSKTTYIKLWPAVLPAFAAKNSHGAGSAPA